MRWMLRAEQWHIGERDASRFSDEVRPPSPGPVSRNVAGATAPFLLLSSPDPVVRGGRSRSGGAPASSSSARRGSCRSCGRAGNG